MAILNKPKAIRQPEPAAAPRKQTTRQPVIDPIAPVLFVIFAVVYLTTRTTYNTFDAVSYSNQIAHLFPRTHDPHWLFHPHHLLFNATGYVLWSTARALGYTGGSLAVLETYNALIASLGIALFYFTLRRVMQRSTWLPIIASCGLGLSFGYWLCATDARVNATSTTLLLGSFAVLCANFERARLRHACIAGLIAGFAVLYHESAGLFLLVGLTFVSLMSSKAPRLRLAAVFVGAWALVVAAGYLTVGCLVLHLTSPAAFRAWSAEYAELGWWWNFNIAHDLRMDGYALRKVAFVEPPGKQGTFHVAADTPTGVLALYWLTLIGWIMAVYYFFSALPLLWRTHYRPILVTSLVWTAVYAAFFTIWSPGYEVFWVPALIPISTILALTMAHYRSRRTGVVVNWLVALWIAMFATVNWMSSIGPHLRPMSDPFQRIAAEYRSHTHPGDVVLMAGIGDLSELEVNIPYFADRQAISVHTALTRAHDDAAVADASMQGVIRSTLAARHDVYIVDDLYRPNLYPDVLAGLKNHHHGLDGTAISPIFTPWHVVPAWTSSHGPVWKITAK